MKIVYIDISLAGHHSAYLHELVKNSSCDAVAILPEHDEALDIKQYVYTPVDLNHKKIGSFYKWTRELYRIVSSEKPDIVHFLTGDVFYKFFGMGLGQFQKYRTVLTVHWVNDDFLHLLSLKRISRMVDRIVVHSDYLKGELNRHGIRNAVHIEYPQFRTEGWPVPENAKKYWGLSADYPVIACIGGTRYDKGLDLLLDALNRMENRNFQLLIAGKPTSFDEAYIRAHSSVFSDRVTLCMHLLSDEELMNAVVAADIIALPYRKVFNGASGPLGEGVWNGKCIVGANHGNLGDTIRKNHLGYTFETENPDDLAVTMRKALQCPDVVDEVYFAYRNTLKPELFIASYMNLYRELLSR